MEWTTGAAGVAGLAAIGIAATPRRVHYTEEADIGAPVEAIYDHIRLQERLMRWSAWPSETDSTCTCEGVDGEIGARTVFFDKKGQRFGHQEIIGLEPSRRVELSVKSKGPPQRAVIAFELEPLSVERTRVVLRFTNQIPRPFNVIMRLAGIIRWTRAMHVKDLDGLKRYAEPPHRTYVSESANELVTV